MHIEWLMFVPFIENIAKVKGMLEENQAHIIVLLKLVQQELENWPPQAFGDSCTGERKQTLKVAQSEQLVC